MGKPIKLITFSGKTYNMNKLLTWDNPIFVEYPIFTIGLTHDTISIVVRLVVRFQAGGPIGPQAGASGRA